jgi:hypothetical protein
VHPPQDEIPLYKETPAKLNNALDLATVRVTRELEAAIGAISEMKPISLAGHVVSEINKANNPITLVDSQISLLLNTLSKFNNVVSNIATV